MCQLEAAGEEFDVDEFLRNSPLKPYVIYHRGERRFPGSSRNPRRLEASGFKVVVSEGSWDDLQGQIVEAMAFLKENEFELNRLRCFPGLQNIVLAFPHNLRIDGEETVVQYDYLPPSLLLAAGNLGVGIGLSLYPPEEPS